MVSFPAHVLTYSYNVGIDKWVITQSMPKMGDSVGIGENMTTETESSYLSLWEGHLESLISYVLDTLKVRECMQVLKHVMRSRGRRNKSNVISIANSTSKHMVPMTANTLLFQLRQEVIDVQDWRKYSLLPYAVANRKFNRQKALPSHWSVYQDYNYIAGTREYTSRGRAFASSHLP